RKCDASKSISHGAEVCAFIHIIRVRRVWASTITVKTPGRMRSAAGVRATRNQGSEAGWPRACPRHSRKSVAATMSTTTETMATELLKPKTTDADEIFRVGGKRNGKRKIM